MKISEEFAGNYLKASDIPQPRIFTIEAVIKAQMPDNGGQKPAVKFVGEQQQFILNKTNAFLCTELFGSDETASWHGRQIELYAATTPFNGKLVPCIRVRAPQVPVQQVPVQQVPAMQPAQQQPVQQQPVQQQPVQQQPVQQQPVQPPAAPATDYPVDA